MKFLASLIFTVIVVVLFDTSNAAARPACNNADIMRPCGGLFGLEAAKPTLRRGRIQRTSVRGGIRTARAYGGQVVGHPPGCPRRAFCGCGASVEVFGRPVRSLWLAANWLRFPRSAPAPGMVAARRGHVFVLRQHIEGRTWLAYDANSGGRRTRIHARSIAGYTIVNPHGSRLASAM